MVLALGIPTAVIPNQWFTRMTPVRPQDYLVLALTAVLAAMLGATYVFPARCPRQEGKVLAGGYLGVLAVGCPICNKLVVGVLGVSGALTYFQPLQPVLALASLVLLGLALILRLRAIGVLPSPRPGATSAP